MFEDIPEDFQESYPCFKVDDGGGLCMGDIIEYKGEWACQTCGFSPNLKTLSTACIVCNGESEKGKKCRNCGDILEGSDHE